MKKQAKKKNTAKTTKARPSKPKKPAKSVRQDKDKYRLLVEGTQDGAFILKDGKIVFANKAFASWTGYSGRNLAGLNFESLLPPEDSAFLSKVNRMRGSGDFDLHLLHHKGAKRVFVRMSLRRIRYDGKAALLGVVRDLTELRNASEALESSERRYRELYDNLRDGFAVVNLKGKITEWNRAFQEMLGYSEREIRKLSYRDITPEKWQDHEAEIVENQVVGRGYSDLYEKEYIRKDGSVFPVTLRTYLMRDEKGKPSGMWAFVRDITDRKKAVEALRQSEEKYRTLFEDSRDAIAITDRDGTFLDVNKAMLDLFGYRKEQMMKMKFQDLYVDPAEVARFQHEIKGKGSLRDHEAKLLKRGGKVMNCLLIATQKRSEDGTITGYQGIVRDITAQKAMEEALRESEKKYKELSITDDLTGLFNQRHFYNQLRAEVDRIQRYKHPLALLLLDVDNFKIYNDTYGHLAGDKVLAKLGEVIRNSIRKTDSGYRYGGEEFTVILTETRGQDAVIAAERLRKRFADEIFFPVPLEPVRVTVSVGVANFRDGEEIASFVKRADQNMYEAKAKGKNCIHYAE
jgi:diguanylate cyclase (GGDEF)-like protein/PAS domain S-box-containing protein